MKKDWKVTSIRDNSSMPHVSSSGLMESPTLDDEVAEFILKKWPNNGEEFDEFINENAINRSVLTYLDKLCMRHEINFQQMAAIILYSTHCRVDCENPKRGKFVGIADKADIFQFNPDEIKNIVSHGDTIAWQFNSYNPEAPSLRMNNLPVGYPEALLILSFSALPDNIQTGQDVCKHYIKELSPSSQVAPIQSNHVTKSKGAREAS